MRSAPSRDKGALQYSLNGSCLEACICGVWNSSPNCDDVTLIEKQQGVCHHVGRVSKRIIDPLHLKLCLAQLHRRR